MMEQNSSKKILLSVLGVAILIVAVVGISFAALNYDSTGGTNTITTGSITMSFSESTNGIYLQNALPMDDTTAIQTLTNDGEFFDFTVNTQVTAAVDVNYEINVTVMPITETATVGALTNDQVKIYLEESANGSAYTQLVAPVLVKNLTSSTLRTGSLKLTDIVDSYDATDVTNNALSTTRYFRLRIWVDKDVDTDYLSATEGKHFEYKVLVNVDGNASILDVAP